jgi:hypothetical protein
MAAISHPGARISVARHWQRSDPIMRNVFRALLAGYAARRAGCGCLSTIILFFILFWLLGYVF